METNEKSGDCPCRTSEWQYRWQCRMAQKSNSIGSKNKQMVQSRATFLKSIEEAVRSVAKNVKFLED